MNTLIDALLLHLAWTSVQAALLVGLLWLLGRLLPRLPAAVRCMLWWLVGMQLLVGLGWQTPVQLPLLSSAVPITTSVMQVPPTASATPVAQDGSRPTGLATRAHVIVAGKLADAATLLPWRQTLAAIWLAGLLLQLWIGGRQWQRTRRLRHTSKRLDDPWLQALCADQARQLGLRHQPELRISEAIDSPQITGMWHPLVLLPARHALTPDEQAMVLAHELAHLRRGDLWLGWIPALARWLFFFHPLVHLALREYTLNREAACDGQALRLRQAMPQTYGRLLLHLGIGRSLPAGLTGAASPTFHHLKRRLIMLQHDSTTSPRTRDWLFVALVALACVLPYRVVAANHPVHATQHAVTVHAGTAIPPTPPVPPVPPVPPTPPVPPAPSIPPAPPVPPAPDNYGFHASHVDIDIDSADRYGFALFNGNSLIIHGTSADADIIKRLPEHDQPMLWFRRDGKTYLTRDKKTIEHASAIYAPLTRLSQQQGRLSGKQGAISGRMAGLSAREAAFSRRQASLSLRQAKLSQRQARLSQKLAGTATTEQSAAERRALDARQRAMDAEQRQLEQAHTTLETTLDAKRQALQKQQAALDKQQQALAQRHEQIARDTEQAMKHLLDGVVAKGPARNVPEP